MTKTELHRLIEDELAQFPARMTGNEINKKMANRLGLIAESDRDLLIHALRDYLSVRIPNEARQPQDAVSEARLWLALDVAEMLRLTELIPDVIELLEDVRKGKTLLPVYENMIVKHLAALRS